MWALVFFIAGSALWAHFAKLEEQIRAPGKVIVSSRSQIVQAVDGGVLKKLFVKEGDQVKAGDLIAELDPARFQASNDEVRAKVIGLRANIVRLEAEMSDKDLKFPAEIQAYPDIVSAQRDLHDRRAQSQREELASIEQSLQLATLELNSLERLAAGGDAARTEVLRARRQVSELQGNATNKRNAYRQDAQTELAKNQADLEQAEQVLAQRNEALQSTKIRAPMSGAVKNVKITTLGAVLKAGDEILQIVPSDDPLIVEAKVKSGDVAFIRPGLHANVKLDAYDYTVYGSLKGHVSYVSPDTIDEELKRDEQPYYRVLIQIDEVPTDASKPLEVIPGMTAITQIITGERTVMAYLLKPLRRISGEALTER
jgi:adhesin transport system membrane fusion protein